MGTFGGSGTGQLNGPSLLYVDNSGNIYVADSANARVVQFVDTDFPQPTPAPVTPTSNTSGGGNGVTVPGPFVCTSFAPVAPNLFQVTAQEKSATLYMVPVMNSNTNYVVSYGLDSSASMFGTTFVNTDTSGVVPFTINSLFPGTWYFRVHGQNGCMPGVWSQTLSVRIR